MRFEYGLDQKVPFIKSLIFGIQWVAVVIPPIIILGKVAGGIHFGDPSGQIVYLQKRVPVWEGNAEFRDHFPQRQTEGFELSVGPQRL